LEFNDAEMEALQNEIEADSESIETSPKRRTRDSAGSGIQAGHQSISFEDESWGSLNDDAIVGSKIEDKKDGKSGLKLNKMTEEEIDEEIKQFDRMDEDDNYSDDDFNFGFGDDIKERERQEAIQTKQLLDDAIDDEVDEIFHEEMMKTTKGKDDAKRLKELITNIDQFKAKDASKTLPSNKSAVNSALLTSSQPKP